MVESNERLLERIRQIMPELQVEHFERNEEGLMNDVLIVNHNLVFRFAKTEEYARILAGELKILDLIRPRIGLSVPDPVHRDAGCMVYLLLGGLPLSLKMVHQSAESTRDELAGQLGAFLYRLHTIDISGLDWELPASRAPVKRQDWIEIWEQVKAKIYPLLQANQLEWAEDLFNSVLAHPEAAEYEPALIHGDFASYHILYDDRQGKISGVIDFGMAGRGDPASDIGNLINIYGETFVQKMRRTYPGLERFLPRARFYAQLIELEWILRGFESGETFWFTAHLANARDIF